MEYIIVKTETIDELVAEVNKKMHLCYRTAGGMVQVEEVDPYFKLSGHEHAKKKYFTQAMFKRYDFIKPNNNG